MILCAHSYTEASPLQHCKTSPLGGAIGSTMRHESRTIVVVGLRPVWGNFEIVYKFKFELLYYLGKSCTNVSYSGIR